MHSIDALWRSELFRQVQYHAKYISKKRTHDIGAVQNHFIVVDAAFPVVVSLIDILLIPFLLLIWLYISNYVV